MEYILIVWIMSSVDSWDYGAAITTAEFQTEELCVSAGEEFRITGFESMSPNSTRTKFRYTCSKRKINPYKDK